MNWITDEVLFYGGAVGAGAILVIAGIFLGISRIRLAKLKAQLDTEYGRGAAVGRKEKK